MTFRDAEKKRYEGIKHILFTPQACQPGTYNSTPRHFCLADECSDENLHEGFRKQAINYFRDRSIPWHDGHSDSFGNRQGLPSNHLCCSQVACVNSLWPLTVYPDLLACVFRPFFPELAEPLPFEADGHLLTGIIPFLAFEWIGTVNYLGEKGRTRGANTTSADFAFRFLRYDGRIHLVLGEWKYTEYYSTEWLHDNKGRVATYREAFRCWRSLQSKLPNYQDFFTEPFYQLMRLTLLAQEMERSKETGKGEMSADIVSVLLIAPHANREYEEGFTSQVFKRFGQTVSAAWEHLAPTDRFLSVSTESLLTVIEQVTPEPLHPWRDYLLKRYAWWR